MQAPEHLTALSLLQHNRSRLKKISASDTSVKPNTIAMSADASQCKAFVESKWPAIQRTLEEYIRIPNQSPMWVALDRLPVLFPLPLISILNSA
jgi:hypothetical protein